MHAHRSRILVFVVALFSSFAVAQSDKQLADRFDAMYSAGKYELAFRAAEQICERHPESAWWQFNAGAVSAKLDQPERAIEYLQRCAQLGFSGIASFEQNEDLDSLRERDDFTAVLELVRAQADKRMGEFQREAKRHKPKQFLPPVSESEQPPLIIALHGTGMDGESMYDAMLETAQGEGMILICPDALRPSGNGFSWTYRDESAWFVNYLIDEAVENHNADPQKVILVGFSQGANIALVMGQTQPDRFLGVVPICGHYEPQVADSDAGVAPFYLMTGARDAWKRTYTSARKDFIDAGGSVQLRVLAGRGHELPSGAAGKREYTRALRWVLDQEN